MFTMAILGGVGEVSEIFEKSRCISFKLPVARLSKCFNHHDVRFVKGGKSYPGGGANRIH